MIRVLIVTTMMVMPFVLFAQFDGYVPSTPPVTPVAYQFLKYLENPVDEYHGIPEISIPIYTIEAGSIKLPIILRYHAGGIRVAEEASWVGLGWNLELGTITQIINDRDDFGNFQKELPDYLEYATPYDYPMEYLYPWTIHNDPPGGWPVSTGISQTHPKHSIVTYTDYYVPFNNTRYQKRDLFNASGWVSDDIVDSEPDQFKASFNGHSLEFIFHFPSDMNTIELLNAEGYKIVKTNPGYGYIGWEITTPDGLKYTFNEQTEVSSPKSQMKYMGGSYIHQPVSPEVKSRTWRISKITGIDNREITFTWHYTGPVYQFPSFSQTFKYYQTGDLQGRACGWTDFFRDMSLCPVGSAAEGCITGANSIPSNSIALDLGFSSMQYNPSVMCYIHSIAFPNGIIQFTASPRNDIYEDRKLDRVEIRNSFNQVIKRVDFFYSYFIGSDLGGTFDTIPSLQTLTNKTDQEKTHRLRLDALTESGKPPYVFVYNSTPLPSKCSFATDYWGYYNGMISNLSLIPNPADLGIPSSQMPSNQNDHKPTLNFLKAATLETIYYPTGGYTQFTYEMNQFSPSFNISEGNGLRIKSIINYDSVAFVSKTEYSYEGGISLSPVRFNTSDSYKRMLVGSESHFYYVNCNILSSSNFFSSAFWGSGSGVGYSTVITEKVDSEQNKEGKVIHEYYNHPDIGFDFYTSRNFPLPLRKDELHPTNGLLRKEEVWHKSVYPVKITENDYTFHLSPVFYGVRIGYNELYGSGWAMEGNCIFGQWERHFCGYYPVYSGWNSLDKTTVTEYPLQGNFIRNMTTFTYDNYHNLRKSEKETSEGDEIQEILSYPYSAEVLYEPGMSELRIQNRINHPVQICKSLFPQSSSPKPLVCISETYSSFPFDPPLPAGSQTWLKDHITLLYGENDSTSAGIKKITVDDYDNYGNVLQFHNEDDVNTSSYWGYNSTYQVIIGKNVTWQVLNTAITSVVSDFESLLSSIGEMTTSGQKAQWKEFNDNLRTELSLSKALITTYTYKPLVGITSITDPSGIATYYEYDAHGRLIFIRDQAGNITNRYEYHYKGQSSQ